MENGGKTRRNPKDSESRDYTCLCGKSYLSYAAAYTHAKNKHAGDKLYIDGIKKPAKQQLKRGRPKEKKLRSNTLENTQLTLIESTILKICEQLEGAFQKIVLEGNEERNNELYQQTFRHLCEQYSDHLHNVDFSQKEKDFLDAIIKDFRAEVAARVRFAASLLIRGQAEIQNELKKLNRFGILWNGKTEVNETIAEALRQWWNIKESCGIDQQNYVQDQ